MNNLSSIKDSVRGVLDQMGLVKLQNRKIGSLSKGQKQRVGLANALLVNPPLLILDEPNAGLDPIGRARILEILKNLVKDEGKTVLLSSHIIGEVDKIATDIAIIHQGRILEQGKRNQIQKGILERSKYVVGGNLDVEKVKQLDNVISCDIDHLGRYLIQVREEMIGPNQLLLDLIQNTEAEIQFFSTMEVSLEDHFLEKINNRSSQEVLV
jgi:ABC-2 type transport system ATP-binding protein